MCSVNHAQRARTPDKGNGKCLQCPLVDMTTAARGASSLSQCICKAEFYAVTLAEGASCRVPHRFYASAVRTRTRPRIYR